MENICAKNHGNFTAVFKGAWWTFCLQHGQKQGNIPNMLHLVSIFCCRGKCSRESHIICRPLAPTVFNLRCLSSGPSLHLFLFLSLLRVDEFPSSLTAACPPAVAYRAFPGQKWSVVKNLPMDCMISRILSPRTINQVYVFKPLVSGNFISIREKTGWLSVAGPWCG